MGAIVHLYNRYDKLIDRVLTNATGEFSFDALAPDTYSVRVTLASFVPAIRKNITIQPGMQSVLAINLANVLSSVELVYSAPRSGTLMSEDWKWVLRSSMSNRPVTRAIPVDISDPQQKSRSRSAVFADTRGVLKVSSGETPTPFTDGGNTPDLGTTFALATSLFGRHQLQFTGNFGYAMDSQIPAAGFRTSLTRPEVGSAVKLTVQQVALPMRGGAVVGAQGAANAPMLRTMSLTAIERLEIGDGLELDYGASLDSVTYLDRLNYMSPFARLRYRAPAGTFTVGYSSGAPPVELLMADREIEGAMQGDLAALTVLPRVSLRDGRAHVQRSENMEIGYRVQIGSRTYSVGAYHEFVRNAALTMSGADEGMYAGSLLPELSSRSSVFNIGNFSRRGYSAMLTQAFGDNFSATLAYGNGGVVAAHGGSLLTNNPSELRSMLVRGNRHWARAIISGVAPGSGTRYSASYEWTDYQSLTPGHVYLTQKLYPETGLNVRVRQPLPGLRSLPGRLEATAELRNLLAQGYLPITTLSGRRLVLANYPRAIRGGLSFIF
jgi:hypothetical protein